MSRLNPDKQQNPAEVFYRWNGSEGLIEWYDKMEEQTRQVQLPFQFLLLDELAKVGGWSDEADSNIYSNEVKNIAREPVTVRTGGSNVIAQGLYTDIKDTVKAKGGHYLASLYIACKDENEELYVANLSLKGAALSAWMDFSRKAGNDVYKKAIIIRDAAEGQKGSITYKYPVFDLNAISEEADERAKELTQTLQEYLDTKQTRNIAQTEEPPPPGDEDLPEEHENFQDVKETRGEMRDAAQPDENPPF